MKYERYDTRRAAVIADLERLRAKSTRFQNSKGDIPAGIPSPGAMGQALKGFVPEEHMTTALYGVREGARDGRWFAQSEDGEERASKDFKKRRRAEGDE